MKFDRVQNDLLRLRARAGLSRRELAKLCGLSANCIFTIENGKHKPRPKTMRVIHEALAIAIRSREKEAPSFSMRCRWCDKKIASIKFDGTSGQMLIFDDEFKVFNGWFYHVACLKEKIEIELVNSDDDLV